jgi:hypothetical protein
LFIPRPNVDQAKEKKLKKKSNLYAPYVRRIFLEHNYAISNLLYCHELALLELHATNVIIG